MDMQNRAGHKFGSSGIASDDISNVHRRERLRKLALETIDINKDPYFMKNHLGSYECKLCLTLHTNEGSYLAHTQGRKHQTNLARRAARDAEFGAAKVAANAAAKSHTRKRKFVKIGLPGYTVTKIREPKTGQVGLYIRAEYPQLATDVLPKYRFMSAYEQRKEPPNKRYQYLIIAAEPYESICFKIDGKSIDTASESFIVHFDSASSTFHLQFLYR